METLPFDFKAWRTRMNLTGEMAAAELYCSISHYWKMEKANRAMGYYVWCAYGKEVASAAKQGAV